MLVEKLNTNKIVNDYADFVNISPEQIVSDEDIEKLRQAALQEQERTKQMQQLHEGMEMIKNVGGADAFGGELMSRLGL